MPHLKHKLENRHFEQIHERAMQFFSYGVKGCIVGIHSIESQYHFADILEKIRAIFQDGENDDVFYLDQVKQRILKQLQSA